MSNIPVFEEVIELYKKDDPKQRSQGWFKLVEACKGGLTFEEGDFLLRAATQKFPPGRIVGHEAAVSFVWEVSQRATIDYLPLLRELIPLYDPHTRTEAIRFLTTLNEREAALAWIELAQEYAMNGGIERLNTTMWYRKPRHADVFFPRILEFAADPRHTADIYLMCLEYGKSGLLPAEQMAPYAETLANQIQSLTERAIPYQQSEGIAWMWDDEDYFYIRRDLGILLDTAQHFSSSQVVSHLTETLKLKDPRLKTFAIASLVGLGAEVDPGMVSEAAASAETRCFLFDMLNRYNKLNLFPETFKTQAALAEGDLVHWLTWPSELGRVPDEIELMKVISVDTQSEDGYLDCYVFRFRTEGEDSATSGKWMAGSAGPYLRNDAPSTTSYGSSFSAFSEWDSMTPEEHQEAIQSILQDWKDARDQKGRV